MSNVPGSPEKFAVSPEGIEGLGDCSPLLS